MVKPVVSEAVSQAVMAFLADRQQAIGRHEPLSPASAVFDSGLLDSVSLIELVATVEQRTGQTVDMLSFDPSAVESVADLVSELSSALQA